MAKNQTKLFYKNVEAFAKVVDGLLKNPSTNEAFRENPVGLLHEHGIQFESAEIEEYIAEEFRRIPIDPQIHPEAVTFSFVAAGFLVGVAIGIGGGRPLDDIRDLFERDDILSVDKTRVDAFLDPITMQDRIKELEAQIEVLKGMK